MYYPSEAVIFEGMLDCRWFQPISVHQLGYVFKGWEFSQIEQELELFQVGQHQNYGLILFCNISRY